MDPVGMTEIAFRRRRSYFSSVLEDYEVTRWLMERYQPDKVDGESSSSLSENAFVFWKEIITLFTRQLPKAIFTLKCLVDDKTFQGKLSLTWLPSILDALKNDGVVEIHRISAHCRENDDQEEVFVNRNALLEACRDVKIAIKAQLYVSSQVPYIYVWTACRKVCEGNERLFRLVLDQMSDVSLKQDFVVFAANSGLLAKGPIAGHGDTLRRLYRTTPTIEKVIKRLLSLEHSLKSEALRANNFTSSSSSSSHCDNMLLAKAQRIRDELETIYEIRDMITRTERVLRTNMNLPERLDILTMNSVLQCVEDANVLLDIVDRIGVRAGLIDLKSGREIETCLLRNKENIVDMTEWLGDRLHNYPNKRTNLH